MTSPVFKPALVVAAGLIVTAGLLFPRPVHPEVAATTRCSATLSPDVVLERLNATRVRGAVCHRPGGAPTHAAPLAWNPRLAAVAAAQAQDMAKLDQMSHRDSLNRNLGERLDAMGYRFSTAVENVAVGYASLDAVVDAWLDSEAHCANLMSAKVAELGLACSDGTVSESGTGRYWTLVLGAPSRVR
ncbi:CAP domain-containing protein [Rhizobacter sp. Root404]|uniref:CAP domain-containing protein n=1 Tax=Rhizobacter sp. Root404 TaxID=1736528 RepID=UPI0009EA1E1C|nr:CAP domain-containing protein [Rhizobacter sp. Root404]